MAETHGLLAQLMKPLRRDGGNLGICSPTWYSLYMYYAYLLQEGGKSDDDFIPFIYMMVYLYINHPGPTRQVKVNGISEHQTGLRSSRLT